MSIYNLCLISTSVLVMATTVNANGLKVDISPNLNNSTHISHTLVLEPISKLDSAFQVAKVQFLPGMPEQNNGFNQYVTLDDNHNRGDCNKKENLFTTKNCSFPYAVVASSKCNFINYYKECKCLPSFSISSCPAPKKMGTTCNGKTDQCSCPATITLTNLNDTCTQTCEGKCIAKNCTPTLDDTDCQYGTDTSPDNCGGTRTSCKACALPVCNSLSSKPSNSSYTTSACTDCNETKTINTGWACDTGYIKSGESCINTPKEPEGPCPRGYEEYGGFWTPITTYPIDVVYSAKKTPCIKQENPANDPITPMPILYSDMSTSIELVKDKTPIGVVFDIKNKKALALEYKFGDFYGKESVDQNGRMNCEEFYIGVQDYYTSGSNYNEEEYMSIYKRLYPGIFKIYQKTQIWDPRWTMFLENNGEENTKIMLQACKEKNKSCPAYTYVNNYQTKGTSAGDWYLPAQQELMIIYYHGNEIRKAVEKAKGHHYLNFPGTGYLSSSYLQEHVAMSSGCSAQYPNNPCLGFGGPACGHPGDVSYFPVINYGKI